MKYKIAVTCKLCHTKLFGNKSVCDCGNVAISKVNKLPHGIVVFVDDLKTVQFSKVYTSLGRFSTKVELPLQAKYQWNWSIIEDVSIYHKFSHWLMPVAPVFVFSGAKFTHYLKRWAKKGFKWFKHHNYNNFEELFEIKGSNLPF